MTTLNKTEILQQLQLRFDQVNDLIDNTSDSILQQPRGDKWSIAQLVHHMILTTASVGSMLKYSPEMIKMRFGLPEHPFRNYEEAMQHIKSFFEKPAKAPEKYSPKSDAKLDRASLKNDWNSIFPKFEERLSKWNEEDLDKYVVPHPLMEKITIREHLYVAIFHIDLHLGQI